MRFCYINSYYAFIHHDFTITVICVYRKVLYKAVMLTRTGHARTIDKDLNHKDQHKDKDLNLVLKESLRTRTRTSLTVIYCNLQLNLQSLSSNNNEHKVKVHNI